MESGEQTCAKCGATWKVIKAAAGGAQCPYCKAPIDATPGTATAAMPADATAPVTATTANPPSVPIERPSDPPATTATQAPAPETRLPDMPKRRPDQILDEDDPGGVIADYDDQFSERRRGMNPVLKAFIVLAILFILIPLAVMVLLAVVCAVLLAK